MAEYLEMVVGGERRAAMLKKPALSSHLSRWSGFFLAEQGVPAVEMPDHWIPNYMVGMQFVPGPTRRLFWDNGKMNHDVIHNESCLVLGPREVRRFHIEKEGLICMLSIDPIVVQEMTANPSLQKGADLVTVSNVPDPVLRDFVLRIRADVVAGFPAGPLFGEALCTRVTEELIRCYSVRQVRLDEYKGGLSPARLRLVLEYVEESLNLSLESAGIAAVAGLSKYHFGKAFKQTTGMTLHRYVLSRRLRRAQELLRNSNLSLADISAAAGFSSQSHLTALFSARTGVSPRRYRETGRRVSVMFHTNAKAH